MKSKYIRGLNIFCYLAIMGYIGLITSTSLASGYPWAVTCYNCGLCRQSCPIGLDPYGFIAAATANDRTALMQAVNVKLLPHEAKLLDKNMVLINARGERVDLADLTPEEAQNEVYVTRMQARYAAAYCILCGNCERLCPINLPIMNIIKDFKDAAPI